MKNIYVDLVIIGGGPAGISAGIYAAMDSANYLLIEAEEPCWFMETSINSHNFVDGFTGTKRDHSGTFLKKSFIDHFKRVEGKILKDTVLSLNKKANYFILITKDKRIIAKAVIITSGTTPKTLKIKSEFKFSKEVHYNCVTDGAKYIGKNIVVVGGRNSGAVAACYLSDLGCKVSIIEIKSKLQAKKKYINSLEKRNINIYTSTVINEMIGGKKLERIKINILGIEKEIKTDAIFLYIGRNPMIDFLNIKIKTDNEGYIIVNCHNRTSIDGLYAAGDVTSRLKQVITACGDGANAYYFADIYLQN